MSSLSKEALVFINIKSSESGGERLLFSFHSKSLLRKFKKNDFILDTLIQAALPVW